MPRFSVQLIGQPAQPAQLIDAPNAIHAVAHAAECDIAAVCTWIWAVLPRTGPQRRHPIGTECYMPRDNSGRQWLARDLSRFPDER